jgi:ribulose-phosphate 3-epimerase
MQSRFDRQEFARHLRGEFPAIMASVLNCDFGRLREEVQAVEAAGAAAIHLDVMDGHFVPNISFGIPIVEAVRRITDLPLDVHLMIDNPAEYVEEFRRAGADNMTVHVEVLPDPRPLLEKIHSLGASAGLAFNPPTPLSAIEASIPYCDLILVMSVMPGFGGQQFEDSILEKVQTLKARPGFEALIEVDGGVTPATIGKCAAAGVDLFVAGSAIFRHDEYNTPIRDLRTAAKNEK